MKFPLLCLLTSATLLASAQGNSPQSQPKPAPDYGKLPLSFEANQGQTDSQVRFTSRGNGYSLFLTDKEAVLALSKREASKDAAQRPTKPNTLNGKSADKGILKTDVVRMQLAGATPGPSVTGEQQLPGTASYFIGNDPAKWHTGVPTYSRVKYASVYPGVDLVYYGNQGQLEYDFVVAPGADPQQVKLHFAGAKKLKLNANGDLMVVAKNGEIAFHKPVVYQPDQAQQIGGEQRGSQSGERQTVESKFTLLAKNTVSFQLGEYDASRQVVIDPALAYSTYLGGSCYGNGIAVDASGNAYLTGWTASGFPVTKGAFQKLNTFTGFVTKLNPSGSALIYSTYLGGSSGSDYANAIRVDALGNAYLTGSTSSADFPVTKGAFQTVYKAGEDLVFEAGNAFVTKLNPSGSALVYSTFLGGSVRDYGTAIAVDDVGNAYVTGFTESSDFPVTKGAFQTVYNEAYEQNTAFVTRVNSSGSSLIYSTYLGGGLDAAASIAIDAAGDAFIAGQTSSPDYPVTKGAFQTVYPAEATGASSAVVSKLNPSGSALIYSTYLGGSGLAIPDLVFGDGAYGIAVDSSGNAYVTGSASSLDFPVTKGAFQTVNRASTDDTNGFVTKLDPSGSSLIYSTYLGGKGSEDDGNYAIAIDATGNAYVTGTTAASDFPVTKNAFQTAYASYKNGANAFMTQLNASGSSLLYSTYLGGSSFEFGTGVALDASGNVYLTGFTESPNFPVTNGAFQTIFTNPGGRSAFVTKFAFSANEVISYYGGFANAKGPIQFNGNTDLDSSFLQLTNGGENERATAFFASPVNVQAFHTEFRFHLTSPSTATSLANIADGFTFTIQNAGLDALGENGEGLGYNGIGNSVAVKFDLHNNDGEGPNSTGIYTDGALPTVPSLDLTGTGIDLHSGHPFDASLAYDGTNLVLILRDMVTNASYTHSFPIDIPTTVGGNTAYVGFTGACGGDVANQIILGWTFSNP